MKAADAKLEHANERLHQHALTPHKSTEHVKHKQADVSTNSHTCRAQIRHTNYSSGIMRDSIAMFIFMMACRDVPLRQLLGASRRRAFGFVKLNTHPKRLEGYGEEHRDRAWRETRDRGMLFACDVGSSPWAIAMFLFGWGVAMFLFGNSKAQLGSVPSDLVDK